MLRTNSMLGLLAAGILAAVGCSSNDAVAPETLEEDVGTRFTDQTGLTAESASCPDELPADDGATVRCAVRTSGVWIGATVEVSEVDGEDVEYVVRLDDRPTAVDADAVAEQVRGERTAQTGQSPTSVRCPDDLPAEVGATVRCTLREPDDDSFGVTVRTTAVGDVEVDLDVEVNREPME